MKKKLTQREKIIIMLLDGWTSPLDAWRELNILTSFRSRMAEIRSDYLFDETHRLEQRDCSSREPNRFGDITHWREFRLVKREERKEIQTSLF